MTLFEQGETIGQHPLFPRYYVGVDGSVISTVTHRWRLLRGGRMGKYRGLQLSDNEGVLRHVYLHCLVAEVFHGLRPLGLEVRHIDGNSENNDATNLCWGTRAQNMRDKERHGTAPWGERHGRSKLTGDDVREMRRLRREGVAVRSIAKQFGMSVMATHRAVTGVSWSHLGDQK